MGEPVIDPAVPERARMVLLRDPGALLAPGAPPQKPRFGGRTLPDALLCPSYAPVWTLLPALMGGFHAARPGGRA